MGFGEDPEWLQEACDNCDSYRRATSHARGLGKVVQGDVLPLFHYSADLVREQTAEETQRSVGEQPLNLIKQTRDTQMAFTPAQEAAYT